VNVARCSPPRPTLIPPGYSVRHRRIPLAFLLVGVLPSMGASYRTDNFAVEAPTKQVAKQVADTAEQCKQRIAAQWLGKRGAAWAELCTVEVQLLEDQKYGASRFSYGNGDQLSRAHIVVKGPLDEILTRVLPHEVTHAVLMLHFGRPIPRWADEGAAVLAEDASKRDEYDRLILHIAERPENAYSMAYLLGSKTYPSELEVFYPQSYSVTSYLVELKGRRTFLAFLADGMEYDWESAVKTHYGFKNVDSLERAWFKHLKVVRARVMARDIAADLAIDLPRIASRLWTTRSWNTLASTAPERPVRVALMPR
jgi:hypothetical protein